MNGDFSGLCLKHFTCDRKKITDIILFEIFVRIFSNIVTRYICLNASFQVLHVTERSFSHYTFEHHTSGDGYSLSFHFVIIIFNIH